MNLDQLARLDHQAFGLGEIPAFFLDFFTNNRNYDDCTPLNGILMIYYFLQIVMAR